MPTFTTIPRDHVGYDPLTGTYHIQHNREAAASLCFTVVSALAAVTGKPPAEIEPLYDVIDPDALGALFRPLSDEAPRDQGVVSFTLEGRPVTVYASGEIVIGAPSRDGPPDDHTRRRPLAATVETAFDMQRTAIKQRQQLARQTLSLQQSVITRTQQLARQTLSLQQRVNRMAFASVT